MHPPTMSEDTIMSSLSVAIEMGNLGIVPLSRSKTITLNLPVNHH